MIEKTDVTTALNESSNWVTAFLFSRHTDMCKGQNKIHSLHRSENGRLGKVTSIWRSVNLQNNPALARGRGRGKKGEKRVHSRRASTSAHHGPRSMTTWKVGARTNARAGAGKTEWRKKERNTFGLAVGGWASNSGHRARMTSNRSRALCQHYVAKSTVVLIRHQVEKFPFPR